MKHSAAFTFAAAVALFVPALLLIHQKEIASARREATRWQAFFTEQSQPVVVSFRVYLEASPNPREEIGIIRRTVETVGDEARMTTVLLPGKMGRHPAGAISFSQDSVIRKDVGLVNLVADIGLDGKCFTVSALREGDMFRITVDGEQRMFEKRLPVGALGAAGSGSIISYLSPFDEHPGGITPGSTLKSWELDPLSLKVRPVNLAVGRYESIQIGPAQYRALPVTSRRFPPATAWYTPDGTLLKEIIPLSRWTIHLERVVGHND